MEKELLQEERIQQLSQSLADKNFGDVMVVGGGISGIQASLDLATAGFKPKHRFLFHRLQIKTHCLLLMLLHFVLRLYISFIMPFLSLSNI